MYARIRTYYLRPYIFGENEKPPPEVRSRDGHTCRTCVAGRATLKSRRPPSLASVQISLLRAVIIEELNFLNWDFFFPGFPEKHAGIIIEGGADLPFPPRFLKIG